MDLHSRLKCETKTCHDRIETASLFKKINQENISLTEYIALLEKIYGFIKPIEDKLAHISTELSLNRNKSPLIENDLRILTKECVNFSDLKHCSSLQVSTLENCLGYLYVMEGSTLGGQIISQSISNQLQLSPHTGCSYFYSYGKESLKMWRQFCQLLNEISKDLNQHDIVTSAISTFNTFYDWLEQA